MPWLLNQFNNTPPPTTSACWIISPFIVIPQEGSVSGNAVDSATELLRNQSTRVFWDTNYVDPSWIDSIITLIPRMKNWVATNYPGTKDRHHRIQLGGRTLHQRRDGPGGYPWHLWKPGS